jgi:hypothetical protein
MEELFRAALSTPFAYAYAFIAFVVRWVELEFEAFLVQTENESTLAWAKRITKIADKFVFLPSFLLVSKKPPPPPTLRRKRPMKDWMENINYHKGRWTRNFMYDKLQAESAFQKLARQTLLWAGIVRVLCLTGIAPQIRDVVLLLAEIFGYGPVMTRHLNWIAEFHGIRVASGVGALGGPSRPSDWLVLSLFVPKVLPLLTLLGAGLAALPVYLIAAVNMRIFESSPEEVLKWLIPWALYAYTFRWFWAPVAPGAVVVGKTKLSGTWVAAAVVATMPLFAQYYWRPEFYVCMLLPLVYIVVQCKKATFLAGQQKSFGSAWAKNAKQDMWGGMSRDEPCKGYKDLSFMHPVDCQQPKDRWSLLRWMKAWFI